MLTHQLAPYSLFRARAAPGLNVVQERGYGEWYFDYARRIEVPPCGNDAER